jgi:hypothetical protein
MILTKPTKYPTLEGSIVMNTATHYPQLVKIGQAAKFLGVSVKTLRRWTKMGKIQSISTPLGTRLYSIAELEKINHQASSFAKNEPPKSTSRFTLSFEISRFVSPTSINHIKRLRQLDPLHLTGILFHPRRNLVDRVVLGVLSLSILLLTVSLDMMDQFKPMHPLSLQHVNPKTTQLQNHIDVESRQYTLASNRNTQNTSQLSPVKQTDAVFPEDAVNMQDLVPPLSNSESNLPISAPTPLSIQVSNTSSNNQKSLFDDNGYIDSDGEQLVPSSENVIQTKTELEINSTTITPQDPHHIQSPTQKNPFQNINVR